MIPKRWTGRMLKTLAESNAFIKGRKKDEMDDDESLYKWFTFQEQGRFFFSRLWVDRKKTMREEHLFASMMTVAKSEIRDCTKEETLLEASLFNAETKDDRRGDWIDRI